MLNITNKVSDYSSAGSLGIADAMVSLAKRIFSKNLVSLRNARGMSQAALARLIGVSSAQISHWEGAEDPTFIGAENLDRLAAALQVPIGTLFSSDPQHIPPATTLPEPKISVAQALSIINALGGPLVIKRRQVKPAKGDKR